MHPTISMQTFNLLSIVFCCITITTQAFAWDCKLTPFSTGSSYIVPLCGEEVPMKLREARVVSNSSSSTYIPASWNFRALSKNEQKTKWLNEYMQLMLTQNKEGRVPKPEYEGCRISFETTFNQGILNSGIAKSATLEMFACRVDQDNFQSAEIQSNLINRILYNNQKHLDQIQKQNSNKSIVQLLNTKAPLNFLSFDPFKNENTKIVTDVKTLKPITLMPISIPKNTPKPETTTRVNISTDAQGILTLEAETTSP